MTVVPIVFNVESKKHMLGLARMHLQEGKTTIPPNSRLATVAPDILAPIKNSSPSACGLPRLTTQVTRGVPPLQDPSYE